MCLYLKKQLSYSETRTTKENHSADLLTLSLTTDCGELKKIIDHNALTSIVSFNLPFSPTMGTFYNSTL